MSSEERRRIADSNDDLLGGKVNEILRLSKWFQLATDMVQSESATLLDVAAALKGLRLKIQNWNVDDAFGITERKAEKFKDDAM